MKKFTIIYLLSILIYVVGIPCMIGLCLLIMMMFSVQLSSSVPFVMILLGVSASLAIRCYVWLHKESILTEEEIGSSKSLVYFFQGILEIIFIGVSIFIFWGS